MVGTIFGFAAVDREPADLKQCLTVSRLSIRAAQLSYNCVRIYGEGG